MAATIAMDTAKSAALGAIKAMPQNPTAAIEAGKKAKSSVDAALQPGRAALLRCAARFLLESSSLWSKHGGRIEYEGHTALQLGGSSGSLKNPGDAEGTLFDYIAVVHFRRSGSVEEMLTSERWRKLEHTCAEEMGLFIAELASPWSAIEAIRALVAPALRLSRSLLWGSETVNRGAGHATTELDNFAPSDQLLETMASVLETPGPIVVVRFGASDSRAELRESPPHARYHIRGALQYARQAGASDPAELLSPLMLVHSSAGLELVLDRASSLVAAVRGAAMDRTDGEILAVASWEIASRL